MLEASKSPFPSPFETQKQLDQLCSQFAQAARAGQRPRIEDFQTRVAAELWPELLKELIAEEVEFRRSQGEAVEQAEYLKRFTADAATVIEVFLDLEQVASTTDTATPLAHATPSSCVPADANAPGCDDPQSGDEVGFYRLESKLGEGAMGTVWKAQHTRLKKPVVIKFLRPGLNSHREALRRFQLEMESVARLDHPNVVRALDAGELRGWHFLVMEYVPGCDLQRYMETEGPLSVKQALQAVRQAASGLAAIHERGLVHRDIKPSNLLLGIDHTVKILDLGFARQDASESAATTGRSDFLGTPDYMAPEQWIDSHNVEPSADIYSLGCTMYFMLTGQVPFHESSGKAAKWRAHSQQDAPAVSQCSRGVPPEVDELLAAMMAKDPARRPAAAQVMRNIDELHGNPDDRPRPDRRRRQSAWLIASLSVILVAVTVFFFRTKDGTIRIEIHDPEIEVAVKGTEIRLTSKDGDVDYRLSPGDHVLIVSRKDLKFQTKNFEVRKGDVVRVVVELAYGQIEVSHENRLLGLAEIGPASPETQRKVAVEVLQRRGGVLIRVDGNETDTEIAKVEQLPAGAFTIVAIGLVGSGRPSDAILSYLGNEKLLDVRRFYAPTINARDQSLDQLKVCPNLVSVHLDRGEYSNEAIARFLTGRKELTELSLAHSVLYDPALGHIASLRKLRVLVIGGKQVTSAGVRRLIDELPEDSLSSLNVVGDNLTDDAYVSISRLSNLYEFGGGRQIGASTIKELSRLKQLHRLVLAESTVSTEALTLLATLDHVQELFLGNVPSVTNDTLQSLPEGVVKLELRNNPGIDGRAFDTLRKLKHLKDLDVTGTKVTELDVLEFHKTRPDCTIQWGTDQFTQATSDR